MSDGPAHGDRPAQGDDADQHEQPSTATNRRGLVLAAAVGAVLIVVLAVVLFTTRDDDDPTTSDTTEDTSTDEAASASGDDGGSDDATGDAPDGSDDTAVDPEAPPTTLVPIGPVEGSGEVELCAAIVERVQQYRDATTDRLPDEVLVTSLEEFEAQVDTLSDDQDWGDRIIEQLTNVRREWATARSAAQNDQAEEAEARNEAALGHLDRAIDTADCPTA
jgi:hypothetical protein